VRKRETERKRTRKVIEGKKEKERQREKRDRVKR